MKDQNAHPVGTLVREDHAGDEIHPGSSVWCRFAEWRGGPHGIYAHGWICLYSSAPGNNLFVVWDSDLAKGYGWDTATFDRFPVVGVIPGSPADSAAS